MAVVRAWLCLAAWPDWHSRWSCCFKWLSTVVSKRMIDRLIDWLIKICHILYTGWQWRNFVPYLCQLVFSAILWVKLGRNVCYCDITDIWRFVSKLMIIMDIFLNQLIEIYSNNTLNLRSLTPHIIPCHTHKMVIVDRDHRSRGVISPCMYTGVHVCGAFRWCPFLAHRAHGCPKIALMCLRPVNTGCVRFNGPFLDASRAHG